MKTSISKPQHPPKVKYFHKNQHNISFQDQNKQHPPKVKYFPNTVSKLVIKRIGDTAYDSYISETLYPLKSAIKYKKQMRFAKDLVTSVKTIPARSTRPHPPKWTINAGDPDLQIPIELSQARADMNLNQDLRGNLSVMSPRVYHHTEETLPTVQLGQFQAQRSDNTTTDSIAHSNIATLFLSEIKSDHNNSSTISENIVPPRTTTSSQREIFSETGTGTSSSKDMTHSDGDSLRKLHTKRELNPSMRRPVTIVLIPGPQHPPKVKYFWVTITILILTPRHPPKVKYQNMVQIVNQAAGKLQDYHHQSQAILQQGCFTHPFLKWQ